MKLGDKVFVIFGRKITSGKIISITKEHTEKSENIVRIILQGDFVVGHARYLTKIFFPSDTFKTYEQAKNEIISRRKNSLYGDVKYIHEHLNNILKFRIGDFENEKDRNVLRAAKKIKKQLLELRKQK